MIDIDELEQLAKAATSGRPGDRIPFAIHAMDPEGILELCAEVRRLREAEKMIVGYVSALLSKDTDTVIEITGRLTNFAFDTAEAKVKP